MLKKIISLLTALLLLTATCTDELLPAAHAETTYSSDTFRNILSTDTEKNIYNDLLNSFRTVDNDNETTYEETPPVKIDGDYDLSYLSEIGELLIAGHPEFFWLALSFHSKKNISNEGTATYFSYDISSQYQTGSSRAAAKAKIYSEAEKYIDKANEYTSPKDKAGYLFYALYNDITYGGEATFCQTISSAFIDKETVCAGFSHAYAFLCNACGIDCIFLEADNHAWNLAKIGDNYYCIDPTNNFYFKKYDNFKSSVNSSDHTLDSTKYPRYYNAIIDFINSSEKNAVSLVNLSFKGDVNSDGFVNSIDATKVLIAYSNEMIGKNSTLDTMVADFNKDGIINSKDATFILMYFANVMAGTYSDPSDNYIYDKYYVF